MLDKRCVIFAAGDFNGTFNKKDGDYLIAADAGFHHLEKMNICPDLLLGDFDTIGEIPKHANIISFNPEKDNTDTELALIEGISRGFSKFLICGATGGKRLEHTIANLTLAASYAEKGYDIILTDGEYIIKALHNGVYTLPKEASGFISVFSISGKAEGVTISGLKYPLTDAVLDSSNPTLGVSNEFIGEEAKISVSNGTLIILWKNVKN